MSKIPETYELTFDGMSWTLPVVKMGDVYLVDNEPICFGSDVAFTAAAGKALANRVRRFDPEIVLTAEAKPLALAYEICKELRINDIVVARKKSRKLCGAIELEEEISSITGGSQSIVLREYQTELLKGKRVALFDDTISTGGTMHGLSNLAKRAGGTVVCISAVWDETEEYHKYFKDEVDNGTLVVLDRLPIYT